MSAVQDALASDVGNNGNISNTSLGSDGKSPEIPATCPMQVPELDDGNRYRICPRRSLKELSTTYEMPVPGLEVGKKYRIRELRTFVSTSRRAAGKIATIVYHEPDRHIVLPYRFAPIADYYIKHPKNIYMSYMGRRGKCSAYIIHFFDGEKLIKLKTN